MRKAELSRNGKNYLIYSKALMSEVSQANIHFKMWKALSEAIKEYNTEFNEARVFFATTIHAHLKAAINQTCKLIDEHGDALGILRFLNFVENNLDIFSTKRFANRVKNNSYLITGHVPINSQLITKYRRKMKSLKSIRKRLTIWRNKKEAHLAITELSSNLLERCPISVNKFEELISTCASILNVCSKAYNNTTRSLDVIGESDWRKVLEAIRSQINS
jgi:HEPN superfamily AbiU2-like protein